MTSQRGQLVALIQQGAIPDDQVASAVQLADLHPGASAWFRFLDRVLLFLGSLALAFSVLFFIAYNWVEMGRFLRFGLVQIAIVLAIACYWWARGRGLVAQAALLAACVLLGVLLALFGQVYQTGADPWQLFFNWALLMLPWVLIGRSAALWLLWLAVLNLSIILYHQVFGGFWVYHHSLYWPLFLINTLALVLWELGARRWSWLAVAWARRLLSLGGGIAITLLMLNVIDSAPSLSVAIVWMVYLLWLAALYGVYRKLMPDLFMLAGACLSLIAVIVYFLGDQLLSFNDAGSFLLLALAILGLSALAAVWLKRVHREMSHE